jgi:hypothetical protein
MPQAPGHHNLFYQTRLEGKPLRLAYAIYLPKGYDAGAARRAMVVFLMGVGECGDNHEGIYVHGPAAELKRNKDLADWADFLVLSPQCPPGMRWETPGLDRVVLDLVELAKRSWRVDPDRVYLTGLSMGGTGTWRIAMPSGGTFAAIAPISANEFEPQRSAAALKGTTVWILCGGADGGYTEGSRNMLKALKAGGIDAIYTEVPDRQHDLWASYYCARPFYEFLLLHRRGLAPPASRPTAEQLIRIAYTNPRSVDARLGGEFQRFLPYWVLLNCGPDMGPGLKERLGGKANVFVTHPLDAATPCRMITTLSVPKGKTTSLDLVVGHHAQGRWRLVVRGNGRDLLQRVVGEPPAPRAASRPTSRGATRPASLPASRPAPPPGPEVKWVELSVDLTPFAGQDVRMELLNSAVEGSPLPAAYWAEIRVNSR